MTEVEGGGRVGGGCEDEEWRGVGRGCEDEVWRGGDRVGGGCEDEVWRGGERGGGGCEDEVCRGIGELVNCGELLVVKGEHYCF